MCLDNITEINHNKHSHTPKRTLNQLRVFVSRSRHKCWIGLNRERIFWDFNNKQACVSQVSSRRIGEIRSCSMGDWLVCLVSQVAYKVFKAENEKIAALDFANAVEREADGLKRSEIKKAEGIRQAKILAAEGEVEAIRLVNEATNKYFVGNAQLLRKLEAVEKSLMDNAKIVIPTGSELVNVIGELAGVLPLRKK